MDFSFSIFLNIEKKKTMYACLFYLLQLQPTKSIETLLIEIFLKSDLQSFSNLNLVDSNYLMVNSEDHF